MTCRLRDVRAYCPKRELHDNRHMTNRSQGGSVAQDVLLERCAGAPCLTAAAAGRNARVWRILAFLEASEPRRAAAHDDIECGREQEAEQGHAEHPCENGRAQRLPHFGPCA